VPVTQYTPPEGVVNSGGEWFYDEYARGAGVTSLGLDDKTGNAGVTPETQVVPPADERRKILDLFRN
jgi:penicillin-binding protein 1A